MKPLEYEEIPFEGKDIDIYIDGRRCTSIFAKLPYIEKGNLMLPMDEIKNEIPFLSPSLTGYMEALAFGKKYDVTIAWEECTKTVYLASVPCYDGYSMAPDKLQHGEGDLSDYDRCFFYVDGEIAKYMKEDSILIIKTDADTFITLSGPIKSGLSVGDKYRFCFQFRNEKLDFLMGILFEIVEYGDKPKIGHMQYTTENWQELINDVGDHITDSNFERGTVKSKANILSGDNSSLEGYRKELGQLSDFLKGLPK